MLVFIYTSHQNSVREHYRAGPTRQNASDAIETEGRGKETRTVRYIGVEATVKVYDVPGRNKVSPGIVLYDRAGNGDDMMTDDSDSLTSG